MLANALKRMSTPSTLQRTKAIAQHMMHSAVSMEAQVLSESVLCTRKYILNRPEKVNALNEPMLNILRPLIEEWNNSELCQMIIGTGKGRGFCSGGDVQSVVENAANEATRRHALDFFKREFEMDYILATLRKPYVVVCDGVTMGGGVGLAAHAPFRIATERTLFAMPETKIGYAPDVGANHFLSRLDGQFGTYMALTGTVIRGRAVFEHGLATHFVPSRRIPQLLDQLSSIETPTYDLINTTIEEHFAERESDEPHDAITGDKRVALDLAFGNNRVEEIIKSLDKMSEEEGEIAEWAKTTLSELHLRSPTSLKVALEAIRRGKDMTLRAVLQMELDIATAFCSGASPDFRTGVTAVLVDKIKTRPAWSPETLDAIPYKRVIESFFDPESPFLSKRPKLSLTIDEHQTASENPMKYALPSEREIEDVIRGNHSTSSGMGHSLDALIAKFDGLRSSKRGVEEKIREVTSRRCTVVMSPDGYHELRWRS